MRLTQIQALCFQEISSTLEHLTDVTVTEDAREAIAVVHAGGVAVIIPAPEIQFTTTVNWSATWDVVLLAPVNDPATTTAQLSPVLNELTALQPTRARPDMFENNTGGVYPGYVVTITDTYTVERG